LSCIEIESPRNWPQCSHIVPVYLAIIAEWNHYSYGCLP